MPRRRWTDAAAFDSVAEGHEAAETMLGADIYAKGDGDGWTPLLLTA